MEELTKAINELTAAINKRFTLVDETKPDAVDIPEEIVQPEKEEKPAPKITFADLKMVLAVLARDGKQEKVKELITKYGATKLSEVPEEYYHELLEEARKE